MPFNIPFLPSINTDRVKNYEDSFSSIWGSIKNIYSQLNVELKQNDQTGSGVMQLTPVFDDLSLIAAGITANDTDSIQTGYRDGDKIRVKTVNVKYELTNTGTAGSTQVANVMLIKHYDNFAGVGPIFNEIYDVNSNSIVNLRLREPHYHKQYKVLYYRRHYLSDDLNNGNVSYGNIFVKPPRRAGSYIEWDGSESTSPSNGKYYLVSWSDDSATVTANWTSRLTYIDN